MFGMQSSTAGIRTDTAIDPDISKTNFVNEAAIGSEVQDGTRVIDAREDEDLSRSLEQRHIQMIALAGAIVSPYYRHLSQSPPHFVTYIDLISIREPDSFSLWVVLFRLVAPLEPSWDTLSLEA